MSSSNGDMELRFLNRFVYDNWLKIDNNSGRKRDKIWASYAKLVQKSQPCQKQPLDNNPTFRTVSDKLDKALGWGGYDDPNQSKLRASIHAGYHETQYHLTGNPREHERAKDQWGVVTGGATDNLKKFDAAKGSK